MREQLTGHMPFPTRSYQATGDLAASSLGDVQGNAREIASRRHVCKKHVYRRGKWFFRCVECGHIEDFAKGVKPGLN